MVQSILFKGDKLLERFNLEKIEYPSREIFENTNWKLEFEGDYYQMSDG